MSGDKPKIDRSDQGFKDGKFFLKDPSRPRKDRGLDRAIRLMAETQKIVDDNKVKRHRQMREKIVFSDEALKADPMLAAVKARTKKRQFRFPFKTMQVGTFYIINQDENPFLTPGQIIKRVHQAAANFRVRHDQDFTVCVERWGNDVKVTRIR